MRQRMPDIVITKGGKNVYVSVQDENGTNTIVTKFSPNAQYNANSRLQLKIEDAAALMAELSFTLSRYQYQNEGQARAINLALNRMKYNIS